MHFRLVPKSTTLDDSEMTLDGNYALCCIIHLFQSQPLKFESRPILSATGILVSSKIKFYADIRGGLLEKGRQMRVGWSKMAIFASFAYYNYIFQTVTYNATAIVL